MAVSIGDLLAAMQNGVEAIRSLEIALERVFPQASTTTTTAPSAGGLTFSSSQPAVFMSVTTSSGGTYKIALY